MTKWASVLAGSFVASLFGGLIGYGIGTLLDKLDWPRK